MFSLIVLLSMIVTIAIAEYASLIFLIPAYLIIYFLLSKDNKKFILILLLNALVLVNINSYENKVNLIEDKSFIRTSATITRKIHRKNSTDYHIKTSTVNGKDLNLSLLYKDYNNLKLEVGDKIDIDGRFSKIMANGNPFMFNYKNYLLKDGITGIIKVKVDPKVKGKSDYLLLKIRKKVLDEIEYKSDKYINDENNSNIIKSIFTGKNVNIESYNELIRDLGISHVFAVSGLHIMIIYSIFLLGGKIFSIDRKISSFFALSFIFIYGYVIGWPASIQRAFIMLCMVEVSNYFKIDWYNLNNLFISAIIVLLINPFHLFDLGFILSYVASFTIIYLYPKFLSRYRISGLILLPLLINLMILPIQATYFNKISLGFLIGNVIILPLFSLVINVSFVFLILPRSLSYLLSFILNPLMKLLDYLIIGAINFIVKPIEVRSFNIFMIILFYCLLTCLYNYHKIRLLPFYDKKILFSITIFTMVAVLFLSEINPIIKLNFIDIGQGDSILVSKNNDSYMVDTGGSYKEDDLSGENLMTYLNKIGVRKLDYVFITHFDEDHAENLIVLNEKYKPLVFSRVGGAKILKEKYGIDNDYVGLKNGDRLDAFGSKIDVYSANTTYKENDKSLVYNLDINGLKILITGDIEKDYERYLVDNSKIKTDILKVAHHGSKTSTSEKFLDFLRPKLAVISVGQNNYGHPDKEVISRIENRNILIKRTDIDGNIEICSSRLLKTVHANRDKFSLKHYINQNQNAVFTSILGLTYGLYMVNRKKYGLPIS
ncbi:MAG: DNA internalization-related competence protein ComEC/Rec2 [Finegoldia sp.]|nr:DNA internalization-related competence protein ComEC/Rec2 [Finegoldia sp.]